MTEQFFRELRERRLFSLAEAYCLEELTRTSVSPERRAELALELSRTFVEHAQFTSGREHDELWQRAAQTVDDVLAADRDSPRRSSLEVQRALVPAARGGFLRRRLELTPYDEALRTETLAALEDGISRLRAAEKPLARRYERAVQSSRRSGREPLTAWELKVLLHEVRYRLGTALLDWANVYPAGSPERSAALLDSEKYLQPLAEGARDDELTLRSRIRLAEILRLRGDLRQANAQLADVEKENPPLSVLNQAVAERVRLMLQSGQPDDAAQLLSRYRGLYQSMPGELWFLDVQSLLAMWRIATEKNESVLSRDVMRRVEETVERAEREAGGHWAWRCRLLLDQARESSRYGAELAELIRRAKAAYANGRFAEAIASYGDAAQQAEQTDRHDAAFELRYTRAAIQLQSGQIDEAADDFLRLADDYPEHEQAAAAHLLSAWCLGRLYDRNRTEAARAAYVEALTRHRRRYQVHPTAYDAVWMLAVLEERRLQATAALKLYQEVPAEHPRGPDAQVGVARCYETILDRLREHVRQADPSRREALKRRLQEWENDAAARLDELASTYPPDPHALTRQQAEVSLRLARIHLNRPRPDYAAADRLLARIFATWERMHAESDTEEPEPPPETQAWSPLLNTARQLRVVSLAGQGDVAEAEQFMQSLSEVSPAEALGVLDGLTQVGVDANEAIRRELGELQLQAAQELNRRREELDPDEQRRLDRCVAQAYVATRQPKRAIDVYDRLLAETPRDKRLLATIARLLTDDCGTAECLRRAREHWRTLESFESPGSGPWLQARLNVARACFALREFDECRKLLAVTKLLYPALGGEELRQQFDELAQQLDALVSR